MSGRLFTVDSRLRTDRVNGVPEEYEYRLIDPLKNGDRISLSGALLPKTVYPVTAGFNNIYRCEVELPGPIITFHNVTIEAGRDYTGDELAVQLEDEIVLQTAYGVGDILVTYDSNTNKLSFENTSVLSIFTIFSRNGQGLLGTSVFSVTELLGIDANDFVVGPSGASITVTMPNQVDLSWPRYLYLDISFDLHTGFADNIHTSTTDHTFILHYAESNFLDVEWWTEERDFRQSIQVNGTVQNIRVRWRPPDFDARNLWNFSGIDHQLIFRLN